MKINSGIYKIINILNGKVYIGSALHLNNRKCRHFSDLEIGRHHNIYLQRSYNKYSKDKFKFEIIEYVEDKEKLIEREQYYIDQYRNKDGAIDYNRCYNTRSLAETNLGIKLSNKTKNKISRSLKGHITSKETKNKISKIHKGKIISIETRVKISKANLGKKRSKKVIKKLSKIQEKRVINLDTGKIFNSIKKASLLYKLKSPSSISSVCRGKAKTAGGYKWSYYNINMEEVNNGIIR